MEPTKTTDSPDYSDAVRQGVFSTHAPKDADRTSTLNQYSEHRPAPMTLARGPAGSRGRCEAQDGPYLDLWDPRSPNPRERDVKGGATRPPRRAVLRDVRQARPSVPFPFSPAQDLAEAKHRGLGRARRRK